MIYSSQYSVTLSIFCYYFYRDEHLHIYHTVAQRFVLLCWWYMYAAVQSQKVVSAYFILFSFIILSVENKQKMVHYHYYSLSIFVNVIVINFGWRGHFATTSTRTVNHISDLKLCNKIMYNIDI